MLNFLFWCLVIYFTFYIVIRAFGKRIFVWFMARLAKKAQKDMQNQAKSFYRAESGPYEKNVFVDDDIKVSIKPDQEGHEEMNRSQESIEEVEFEEFEQ